MIWVILLVLFVLIPACLAGVDGHGDGKRWITHTDPDKYLGKSRGHVDWRGRIYTPEEWRNRDRLATINWPWVIGPLVLLIGIPYLLNWSGERIERENQARTEARQVKHEASKQKRAEFDERRKSIIAGCRDCLCLDGSPGYIGYEANGKSVGKYTARKYNLKHPLGNQFSYTHKGSRYCTACSEIVKAIYVKRHGKYPNPLAL